MSIVAKAAYLTGSVIALLVLGYILYKGERDRKRRTRQKLQRALAKSIQQKRVLDRLKHK